MYDLGDVAHLTWEVRDLTGTLVDSTVAVNITLPDQTVAGPFSPTRDSLGKYSYDYTTVQAGRHAARATGTAAPFAHTSVFDVEPAVDISIVSLADVKKQLTKTTTTDDDELRSYILSASENIESTIGICAVRSFTERCYPNTGSALILTNTPVVSLTSFTPVYSWDPALSTGDVTVNPANGVVTRIDGWAFYGPYNVTYKAGRAVVQSSLRLAGMLIVQHLWDTRRGQSSNSPYGGDDMVVLPGWGYAIPNRAAELLGAVPQVAGFA
jgi:hypothetical protein